MQIDIKQLKKDLAELSTKLDNLEYIEKRHVIIENLPLTSDPELVSLYIKNLSSNSENGQWTLDETIFGAISMCDTKTIMKAIFSDLSYFSTERFREHLAIILSHLCRKDLSSVLNILSDQSVDTREKLFSLIESYPDIRGFLGQ